MSLKRARSPESLQPSDRPLPTEPNAKPQSQIPEAPKKMMTRTKPNFLQDTEIITVELWNNNHVSQMFSAHKHFITHYSQYFARAFAQGKQETRRGSIRIYITRQIRPAIFQTFLNWIYTQTITDTKGQQLPQQVLVDLWRMAEEFVTPRLQNQAADTLYRNILRDGFDISLDLVNLYKQIPDTCPLRDVFVAAFAGTSVNWTNLTKNMLPENMLFELFKIYKQNQMDENCKDLCKPLDDVEMKKRFHVSEEL